MEQSFKVCITLANHFKSGSVHRRKSLPKKEQHWHLWLNARNYIVFPGLFFARTRLPHNSLWHSFSSYTAAAKLVPGVTCVRRTGRGGGGGGGG